MELRVLQYFLSVAREESITGAAKMLNISQPALSRQLKELEDELDAQLFLRGSRKIELTEEGMLLRKRAEEILMLVDKATHEVTHANQTVAGDIYIGSGESDGVKIIMSAAKRVQILHPDVHFHIITMDSPDIAERLDNGLIDFGILFDPLDMMKYNTLRLPVEVLWGLLMRKDAPLANQNTISKKHLLKTPLITSRHLQATELLRGWLEKDIADVNVIGTYNLLYNCSLMVEAGIGNALCIDGIMRLSDDSPLCFRPFYPEIRTGMNIAWKKYQVLSKPAEIFIQELTKTIG